VTASRCRGVGVMTLAPSGAELLLYDKTYNIRAPQHDHLFNRTRARRSRPGLACCKHRDLVGHGTAFSMETAARQVGSEERPPWATARCVSREKSIRLQTKASPDFADNHGIQHVWQRKQRPASATVSIAAGVRPALRFDGPDIKISRILPQSVPRSSAGLAGSNKASRRGVCAFRGREPRWRRKPPMPKTFEIAGCRRRRMSEPGDGHGQPGPCRFFLFCHRCGPSGHRVKRVDHSSSSCSASRQAGGSGGFCF